MARADASHCSLISALHVTEFKEIFLLNSFGHFGPKKPGSNCNPVNVFSTEELVLSCVFTEDNTTVFLLSVMDGKASDNICSFAGEEKAGFHTDFISVTFSWSSTLETDLDLFSCFSFFFFFFFFLLLCFLCFLDFFFDESLLTSSSEVSSADFNSFAVLSVSIVTGFASSRFSVFIVSS